MIAGSLKRDANSPVMITSRSALDSTSVAGAAETPPGFLGTDLVGAIGIMVVIFVLYFTPALVASNRNHPQATPIALLNLFLGWTVLGWIIALIWAATTWRTNQMTIVAAKDPQHRACLKCGAISSGGKFCPGCGLPMPS